MGDELIPKATLGKLVIGKSNIGLPRLSYKESCKRYLKNFNIGLEEWEEFSGDCIK